MARPDAAMALARPVGFRCLLFIEALRQGLPFLPPLPVLAERMDAASASCEDSVALGLTVGEDGERAWPLEMLNVVRSAVGDSTMGCICAVAEARRCFDCSAAFPLSSRACWLEMLRIDFEEDFDLRVFTAGWLG